MILLIGRCREQNLSFASISTACSWAVFDLENLVVHKSVAQLFLLDAISHEVLDMGGARIIRISRRLNPNSIVHLTHTLLEALSRCGRSHNFVHFNGSKGILSEALRLWFVMRIVFTCSVFSMHGTQLLELFRILHHVVVV